MNRRRFLATAAGGAAFATFGTNALAQIALPSADLPPSGPSADEIRLKYLTPSVPQINGPDIAVDLRSSFKYQNAGSGVHMATAPAADAFLQQLVVNDVALADAKTSEAYPHWIKKIVSEAVRPETLSKLGAKESARQLIHAVHTGKGAPSHLRAVLAFVYFYRQRLAATFKTVLFTDAAKGLATYVAANVGLDCNGFTGHYARAVGFKRSPQNEPTSYANVKRRTSLLALRPRDVVQFPEPNRHVGVIDAIVPVGFDTVNVVFVESVADGAYDGLTRTTSKLQHLGGDKFRFTREGQSHTREVFVARLDDGIDGEF